jgi:hypothetical protein
MASLPLNCTLNVPRVPVVVKVGFSSVLALLAGEASGPNTLYQGFNTLPPSQASPIDVPPSRAVVAVPTCTHSNPRTKRYIDSFQWCYYHHA